MIELAEASIATRRRSTIRLDLTEELAMATGAQEYYRSNATAMKPVRESMPATTRGFGGLHQATMSNASLSVVEKELIALAIGLAVRCENCIYAHIKAAVLAGATRAQVLDAAGVAVMMAGGPGYTYLPRVVEALDALEVHADDAVGAER